MDDWQRWFVEKDLRAIEPKGATFEFYGHAIQAAADGLGIAMGLLEAIVVVYLRKLYYPHGFDFPLTSMPNDSLFLELVREICTIVMLAVVAFLTGKTRLQRFAWFLFTFAIWDIFYYAGLKIFLQWPASLFTWDILFLIPVPWVAPVLAPIICSLTMILLAVFLMEFEKKRFGWGFRFSDFMVLSMGVLIILVSFMKDYINLRI